MYLNVSTHSIVCDDDIKSHSTWKDVEANEHEYFSLSLSLILYLQCYTKNERNWGEGEHKSSGGLKEKRENFCLWEKV